jgi:hypothetical protein
MAEAGGKDASNLDNAVAPQTVQGFVEEMLDGS